MSNDDYIKNTYGFQDENIIIDKFDAIIINSIKHKRLFISNKNLPSDFCCPRCGSVDFIKHGSYQRTIRNLDISGFKSIIIFNQKRFICKDCNKTFNEPNNFVESNCTISKQAKLKILEDCRKKKTFTDIAEDNNVSVSTTYNEFVSHIGETRKKLTEVICVDEFRAPLKKEIFSLIIGDPISGKIIDCLEGRKQDFLIKYFNDIPIEEKKIVKYIVMDLYEPYKVIFKEIFPKAIIIADRFHVSRLVTNSLDKLRIRIMNIHKELKNDKSMDYYNMLKKDGKVLLANKYANGDFYYEQVFYCSIKKRKVTLQERLEDLLRIDEALEFGYMLLQDFYRMMKFSSYEAIGQELFEFCKRIDTDESIQKEFKHISGTLRSWKDEIRNSFIINPITKKRLTNGFIEGKNNLVKTIQRAAFGYKDFNTFRAKILYVDDKNKPYKN